jgi:hypothetical protein
MADGLEVEPLRQLGRVVARVVVHDDHLVVVPLGMRRKVSSSVLAAL